MTTPEEDFETWKLVLSTVTDDVSSFSSLFPDFQRLLRSIQQTGSLPGDLSSQTNGFIDIIYPTIINPLLDLGVLDDGDVLILIETFQTIIECCASQLANSNISYSEIIENLFTQEQKQLYKSNSVFEIRESLINFFISIDGYQKCLTAIESENENPNKLSSLFNICMACSSFLEEFDSNQLMTKTAVSFCNICDKDIRSFPTNIIDKIYSKIEFNAEWLLLLLKLLRSDFFDKKLFSLQMISKIIGNDKNKEIMTNFLKENLEEIISIPIHSEFGKHIGTIYGFAASNSLLNIDHIKNIWKSEEFIHPSTLQSFYSIFEILSNKLPEAESIEYSNLIIDSKREASQIWLNLIKNVAKHFMENKFSEAFEILRNKIWSLAFPNQSENKSENLAAVEKSAKSSLDELCQFNSQIFINKILETFSEVDDFCLKLIQKAASGKEPIENGKELIDLCITKLPNEEAVKLISTLCIEQKTILTPEQKELIVNHEQKDKYLEKIIFDVGFDNKDIEQYFYSLNEVNMETYFTIIKYVSSFNHFSDPLTSVPFMKEDLIWYFALKPSRVFGKFQEFLCYNYSMNDGVILTDEQMIDVFLKQCLNRYEISDKHLFYKLLGEFIKTVEKTADVLSYDFKRHLFGKYDHTISINASGIQQEFRLKRNASASVLLHKISAILRRPPEYINLFSQGYPVAATSTFEKFGWRENSIFLTYQISQNPSKVPHLRTVLPTLNIHRSPIMEKLLQSSKTKKFNFSLKMLLNILPSSIESSYQVSAIKKVNSFDYDKNFPLEFPLLFIYNFEVMREKYDELKDHIKRTGGLHFFAKSLLKFYKENEILTEIIEWFAKIIPENLDTSTDDDLIQLSNELFEILLHLLISPRHPDVLNRALNLMKKLNPKVPPYDPSYIPHIVKHEKPKRDGWGPWGHWGHWGKHEGENEKEKKENQETINQASNVPLPENSNDDFDKPDQSNSQSLDNENSIPDSQDSEKSNDEQKVEEIDQSIPISHLLADAIPTFLFSDIDAIKNSSEELFKKLEIPIEYFEASIEFVDIGRTKSFIDVLMKQLELNKSHGNVKAPTKLIEFSMNNLNLESKYLAFALTILNLFIDYCSNEQKNLLASFIQNNFFKLYRQDFDTNVINIAFEIIGKLPDYLPDCFAKIQDNNEPIDPSVFSSDSDYLIDGSDYRIERQTTGLANLGMTCFINSILQQFFSVPSLRKIIIEYNGDDDFLIELRKLFCRMRESFSAWVSPKNVTDHWINWDGTKLNVHVQQDASEFVQMFVDKIAAIVPPSMFNGTLIYHIDGINDDFHSSHSEPYSIISLPITESNNLTECFNSLKTPNFFNDYLAESLNKKIEAKQTEFIGNIPDHLIIQLKRFEFDYRTMDHRKINKNITIDESIDIINYLDENYIKNEFRNNIVTKYNLNGIVLHMGSAKGGHYFSFVRNRNTGDWFKFNDKTVSPITIQDVLKDSNGSNSNAYLLFYDKDNLFEIDDSKLNQQLQDEINMENKMNTLYRFFYTKSFTHLLEQLLEGSSENLIETAIKYSMPIMAHLNTSIDCLPIYRQIKLRIENDKNIDLILDNLHISDFVRCPSSLIRDRYFGFVYKPLTIKLLDDASKAKLFYNEVFAQFDKATEKLDEMMLYFRLLYRLLKIVYKQSNPEEIKLLSDKIANIFITIIPNYLKEHKSIQPSYYYNSLDLGLIMKFYRIIEIPQSILLKMQEPPFLTMLMSSKTVAKRYLSVYNKAREMNLFDVDKFFIEEFLPKESMNCNMHVLFSAMFILLQEKALPLIWSTKFKIKDQFYVPSDIAFSLVLLTRNSICDNALLDGIDSWLPSIFLHENHETRILAPFTVSFLIRHKSFLSLGSVPTKDSSLYDKAFFEVVRMENPVSEEVKAKINKIKKCLLDKCLSEVQPLIEKEIDINNKTSQPISKYRAVSLLNLINCLSQITYLNKEGNEVGVFDSDDHQEIMNFADFLVNHSNVCDPHIREVAKIINEKSTANFIMKILPTGDNIPSESGLINRISDVLEILLPRSDELPHEYVLNEFIPSYIFTPISIFHKSGMKFLSYFCDSIDKESLMKLVDKNFDDNCIKNISAVLFILHKFNEKRPVLKYALRADTSSTPLSLNEIIEFGFKCNLAEEAPSNSESEQSSSIGGINKDVDIISVVDLLNSNRLNQDVKPFAWNYLIEKCNSITIFTFNYKFEENIQFSLPDDFVSLAKLLMKFESGATNDQMEKIIIPHLIKLSKISFEGFIECFDFLKAHETSNKLIQQIDFVSTIFSLVFPYIESHVGTKEFIDINQNSTMIDLCQFIFNQKADFEKYALVYPLIVPFIRKIRYNNQVLNNPVESAFTENELINSLVPLFLFFSKFDISFEKDKNDDIKEFYQKLNSEEICNVLKLDKINCLIDVVKKFLKI